MLTIERPEQLKALGHPLRLRVLDILGESGADMTNRELAQRLGVDPGHLHFHVKMLLGAGLIALADESDRRRREKPYRAVAAHVRVAPELVGTGAANDARASMLQTVQEAWATYAAEGRFRSAQMTIRLDPDLVRDVWRLLVERSEELEDDANEPLLITLFSHPHPAGDD